MSNAPTSFVQARAHNVLVRAFNEDRRIREGLNNIGEDTKLATEELGDTGTNTTPETVETSEDFEVGAQRTLAEQTRTTSQIIVLNPDDETQSVTVDRIETVTFIDENGDALVMTFDNP